MSSLAASVYPEERKKMGKGAAVKRLLDYLKVADRLESAPGFSHALHLNHGRLLPQNFTVTGDRLVYRHVPPPEICLTDSRVSLGTHLAILDEVTTWALLLNGKRPGVSVNLYAELGPAGGSVQAGTPVDIIATVQKAGRSLGFVQAEIRQQDQQLLSFGGHVKFLRMGFWKEILLSRGWPLVKLYSRTVGSSPTPQTFELKELFEHLKFKSFEEATFTSTTAHASHGGALHGGCQSILMELVGEQTARDALSAYKVELESINITYQSPGTPSVVIRSKVVVYDDHNVKMKVTIRARTVSQKEGGRIISEGLLQWRRSDAPSTASSGGPFSGPVVGSCYKGARRKNKTRNAAMPVVRNTRSRNVARLEDISSVEDSCSSVYTPGSGFRFDKVAHGGSIASSTLLPPSLRFDDDASTLTPLASPKRNEHPRQNNKTKREVRRTSSPGLLRKFDPYDVSSSEASSLLPPSRRYASAKRETQIQAARPSSPKFNPFEISLSEASSDDAPGKSHAQQRERNVGNTKPEASASPVSNFDPFDALYDEASPAFTPARTAKQNKNNRRKEVARSSSPGLAGKRPPANAQETRLTATTKRKERFHLFAAKKEKAAKVTTATPPRRRGDPDETSIQTPNQMFQIPCLKKDKGVKKAPKAKSPVSTGRDNQDDFSFPSSAAVASFQVHHVSPYEATPVTDFEVQQSETAYELQPASSLEPNPASEESPPVVTFSQPAFEPQYYSPALRIEDYDVSAIPTAEISSIPFAMEQGRRPGHGRHAGKKKYPPSSRRVGQDDVRFLGSTPERQELGYSC